MAGSPGFVAATTAKGTSTGTTLTINVPAGVADGDQLVVCVSQFSNLAPSNEAGWSTWITDGNKIAVATRTASSEPASYTFDWGLAQNWRMGIMALYDASAFVTAHIETATALVTTGTHADVNITAHAQSVTDLTVLYWGWAGVSGPPFQWGALPTWTADSNTSLRAHEEIPAGASYDNSLALFDEYLASSSDEPARAFDFDWFDAAQDTNWRLARHIAVQGPAAEADHWAWAEGSDASDAWQIL